MFLRRHAAVFLSAPVLVGLFTVACGKSSKKDETQLNLEQRWDAAKADYLEACVPVAKGQAKLADIAQPFCLCTFEEVKKKSSIEQVEEGELEADDAAIRACEVKARTKRAPENAKIGDPKDVGGASSFVPAPFKGPALRKGTYETNSCGNAEMFPLARRTDGGGKVSLPHPAWQPGEKSLKLSTRLVVDGKKVVMEHTLFRGGTCNSGPQIKLTYTGSLTFGASREGGNDSHYSPDTQARIQVTKTEMSVSPDFVDVEVKDFCGIALSQGTLGDANVVHDVSKSSCHPSALYTVLSTFDSLGLGGQEQASIRWAWRYGKSGSGYKTGWSLQDRHLTLDSMGNEHLEWVSPSVVR